MLNADVCYLQDWSAYTVTPVVLEWDATPGTTVSVLLEARYPYETPAYASAQSKLPDWSTEMGSYRVRQSVYITWTV